MTLALGFTFDRDTIIKAALRRVRGYDPEDATTISTVQYNNAAETLNLIVSSWQADGLQVWAIKTSSAFTMTASQGVYTIGYTGADIDSEVGSLRPLDILRAWLRDTTTDADTPLEIINRERYDLLSVKTSTGLPVSLYFDAAFTGGTTVAASIANISLWPEPDSTTATNKRLYLVYQRPFLDFQASTDNLDMPQEWFNAVRLFLAYSIAPEYGMPMIEYDRLKAEAMEAKILAMSWDREKTSLYIMPNNDAY